MNLIHWIAVGNSSTVDADRKIDRTGVMARYVVKFCLPLVFLAALAWTAADFRMARGNSNCVLDVWANRFYSGGVLSFITGLTIIALRDIRRSSDATIETK